MKRMFCLMSLLLALVVVVSCGETDQSIFDAKMESFRAHQASFVNKGCILIEEDIDNIQLDCSGVINRVQLESVSDSLGSYVAAGNDVLNYNSQHDNKYLDETAQRRITRKISLANGVRNRIRVILAR